MAVGAGGIRLVQLRPLTQRQSRHALWVLLRQLGNVGRGRRDMFPQHLLEHPHAAPDGAGSVG